MFVGCQASENNTLHSEFNDNIRKHTQTYKKQAKPKQTYRKPKKHQVKPMKTRESTRKR